MGGLTLVGLALAFPVLLTIGAASDLLRYLIPNWISLALAALSIPALLLAGIDLAGLLWHLAVGLAVFGLTSILFFRGMIGGGDVKLLAAVSCWTGWPLVVPFIIYTAIAGGLLTLTLLVLRRVVHKYNTSPESLSPLFSPSSGIPYGAAIATGGWLIWTRLTVFSTAFAS